MSSDELNAVVASRVDVAPGLMVLRVAPQGWELPPFREGQFAVLGLPGRAPRTQLSDPEEPPADPDQLIRRAYSIASAPRPGQPLEFFVSMVRSGSLTPRLFALQPGDRLHLGPRVTGLFTLRDVPEGQDLALVATGTGLAPYMAMLRGELAAQRRRKVAVLLGARHSWDLGYVSELEALSAWNPELAFLPIISRPELERVPWGGPVGHVQQLWTGGALAERWGRRPTPADTHVFLCGNPAMIEGMTRVLEGEGFTLHQPKRPGQIHHEKYW